jgi:HlyD family secretion protein
MWTLLKRFFGLVVIVAIVAALYLAMRPQPVLVDIATVAAGPMKVTINREGITRVQNIFTVHSPMAGRVSRTALKEGDHVMANTTIVAAIHPNDPPFLDRRTEARLRAAVEVARSAIALSNVEHRRALSALTLAESDLERARTLAQSKTISARQLQLAENTRELAAAQVESAKATISLRKAELASAQSQLMQPEASTPELIDRVCCVELTAPIDGVVLNVLVKSERAVTTGTPIMEIGDVSDLEIAVELLSSDAVRISEGAAAIITDWGGPRDISATVVRIDPAATTKVSALGIEEQRVNVILEMSQPELQLGHGFRVFVQITEWQSDNVLQVPLGALFRVDGDWTVFVVRDEIVAAVAVEIGRINDEIAQVLGGLENDDHVVLHPSDQLSDGAAVAIR